MNSWIQASIDNPNAIYSKEDLAIITEIADYQLWDQHQASFSYISNEGLINEEDSAWSYSEYAELNFGKNWKTNWSFGKFWELEWCEIEGCEM